MKPDRRPLRLRDERPRSDVLRTNAMIPPPHGFAPAEDSIGNEKNITFLGRELCRSLRQSGPPSYPLWVKSGHMQRKTACPRYPRKRRCAVQLEMSALGQKRTWPGQIGWLLTLEDAIDVASGASVVIEPVRPVRDQAASGYKSTIRVHCRKLIPGRQCNYLLAVNEGRGAYYSRISVARERAECGTVTPIPLAVLRL